MGDRVLLGHDYIHSWEQLLLWPSCRERDISALASALVFSAYNLSSDSCACRINLVSCYDLSTKTSREPLRVGPCRSSPAEPAKSRLHASWVMKKYSWISASQFFLGVCSVLSNPKLVMAAGHSH
ncbi:hypothetical protein ATANTOWER_007481 [Ataeniobius toweri]|uniref:Uncharacterized protein n=1 Tax=Ataeniobius toweri TaxID=208326 RepID=A0ABU7C6X6_9TELE|nr:hypothetical protein [Ataeniobius toweri]